jgi:Uma2 family endonuclease
MTGLDPRPASMTAEELLAMPDDDRKYELVNGELRVSEPPDGWHGALAVRRFFEGAPDFVAEIVSPGDAAWEVDETVAGYLERGVRLVWVVYPRTRRAVVHTPAQTSHAAQGDDVLDGGRGRAPRLPPPDRRAVRRAVRRAA